MKADVDGMVDEALDASREGGLPSGVVRYVDRRRGRQGHLPPRIAYSQDRPSTSFVARLADEINQEPVDAVDHARRRLAHADARARTGSRSTQDKLARRSRGRAPAAAMTATSPPRSAECTPEVTTSRSSPPSTRPT